MCITVYRKHLQSIFCPSLHESVISGCAYSIRLLRGCWGDYESHCRRRCSNIVPLNSRSKSDRYFVEYYIIHTRLGNIADAINEDKKSILLSFSDFRLLILETFHFYFLSSLKFYVFSFSYKIAENTLFRFSFRKIIPTKIHKKVVTSWTNLWSESVCSKPLAQKVQSASISEKNFQQNLGYNFVRIRI